MDDTASSSLVGAPERTESRQRPGCGKAAARKLAERANMIPLYAIVRDIHAILKVLLARVRGADRPQLTGTINRRDFAAVATPVTSAHVVNS
jgi:hypothetical protein